MTKLTRNGVCYDLLKSPFKVEIEYQNKKVLTFKFSSQTNIDRFNKRLEQNRKYINNSLSKRFKFEIVNNLIADIKLYSSIESKGFLLISNGVLIECLENLRLNGVEVMKRN